MPKAIADHKKAAVIGAGRSGRAAARLLHALGMECILLEKNPEKIPADFMRWISECGIPLLPGEHKPEYFRGIDLIIPSPAAAKRSIEALLQGGDAKDHVEIMAESELAWRLLDGEPVIGITGTSGKTTTTSICSAMLAQHGLRVFTGGNIGVPLSEYVLERISGAPKADAAVLELSSFQLQTCSTLHPHVGVLLNISENHLDFHADMQEYTEAKMRLFACQDENDLAILHPSLAHLAARYGMKAKIATIDIDDRPFPKTRLIGQHNQINASAAYLAAARFGVTRQEAALAMEAFTPIPHRLEYAGAIRGVTYVNDSKCTTVEALKVALASFQQPVILLAGGKFKGGDLEGMRPLVQEHVKAVALYGASRSHFEDAWAGAVPLTWDETMDQAFERARSIAQDGDTVLLAPATSSFDQYNNYKERGSHFKSLVQAAGEKR